MYWAEQKHQTALTSLKLVQDLSVAAEVIDHKFMTSGHSYLPNDSDFGSIEKCAKGKFICTHADWYSAIVKSCERNCLWSLE
jgi:hypothetical protein